MGVAYHGEKSVLGSMLGPRANLWISQWKALSIAQEGAGAA
jgi:hypothetical protein